MQHYTNTVTNYSGDRVVGAVATVSNLDGTPAVLYSDAAGLVPIGYQTTTDAHGQFAFYVAAGRYNIAITGSGIASYTLSDVQISNTNYSVSVIDFGADKTGSTDSTSAFTDAYNACPANGTISIPNGTYITSVITGSKYVTWVIAGVKSSGTWSLPGQIIANHGNATAVTASKMRIDNLIENSQFKLVDEAGIWGGDTYTYFGVSAEVTATTVTIPANAPQIGIMSFINNNNSAGDVVAILGDAVARTNGDTVFGGNLIARNASGTSSTKLVGLEIDIEPAVGTTDTSSSCGIIFNVYSIASAASVGLIGAVGGGTWANGVISSHIRGSHYAVQTGDPTTATSFINTSQGTFSNAAIVLGTGAAQSINLGGGSFGTSPYLYGDAAGGTVLNMGSNGFVTIQNPAGAQRFTFDQFGTLNMPNNGALKINTVQVVALRQTGWSAMTGTGNKATIYDTSTITLAQLAGRVMQLQADLTTHGLIGA